MTIALRQVVHCAGCGYENPIALGRCPRCGCSEETIAARAPAAACIDVTEPDPPVEPPAATLTLATKVSPLRARSTPPEPLAPSESEPGRPSRRARRNDADWVPIAVAGGAILAFLFGTMVGVSMLPSHPAPAPHRAPASLLPPEPVRGAIAAARTR